MCITGTAFNWLPIRNNSKIYNQYLKILTKKLELLKKDGKPF